ncbi:bacterial transcriptional activator domain-containing protein [Thermocatellispora tengchongensis]|uniref:bacterial transcriptional activator domain-containing protein n=1 Tax=Thermocatellispora tengchongensis TaxID=1073253 RepID=UPI00364315BE
MAGQPEHARPRQPAYHPVPAATGLPRPRAVHHARPVAVARAARGRRALPRHGDRAAQHPPRRGTGTPGTRALDRLRRGHAARVGHLLAGRPPVLLPAPPSRRTGAAVRPAGTGADVRRGGAGRPHGRPDRPLRDTAHEALIRAYVAQGNRNDAISHYRAYRRQLRDELGLEPAMAVGQMLWSDAA